MKSALLSRQRDAGSDPMNLSPAEAQAMMLDGWYEFVRIAKITPQG